MKRVILVSFVAIALLLCFSNAEDSDDSSRDGDSRRSRAFLSRRESVEVVKHQKKSHGRLYKIAATPARSPLEPYREVCEANLACDELADQIGFKAAYRRFYGPIRF